MVNLDFYSEFKNYAMKHLGISGIQFPLLGETTR